MWSPQRYLLGGAGSGSSSAIPLRTALQKMTAWLPSHRARAVLQCNVPTKVAGRRASCTHQISNLTVSPLGTRVECDMKAAPIVTFEEGSNAPRTYRSTRQDLPTPCDGKPGIQCSSTQKPCPTQAAALECTRLQNKLSPNRPAGQALRAECRWRSRFVALHHECSPKTLPVLHRSTELFKSCAYLRTLALH